MPPAIDAIRNNPGKRPPKKPAVTAPPGVPECPAHLTDGARAEWDRIVPELQAMGVLAKADRAALAAYCTAFGRWEQAENELLATGGPVVKAPKSDYPIQNPWLSIANKAMEQMRQFLSEFGMSPSSRNRASTLGGPEKADPADAFFKGPKLVS